MSTEIEKILLELLEEQQDTSLFTMTLERDRLYSALAEAGLAVGVVTSNEFTLAVGATQTVIQLVPPGFIYLIAAEGTFYTSLPWWVSYSMWIDQTPPAVPVATATRMPGELHIDFAGIFPIRAFLIHTCINLHAAQLAYAMVKNIMFMVSVETWDMIREVYLDELVKQIREKALRISGLER